MNPPYMPTENMCITIPDWIHNWIKSQPGKKSTIVTEILKQHIVANAERKQKTLIEMTPDEKEKSFAEHMKRVWRDMEVKE